MRCARDLEVETKLTCSRCGTPICPQVPSADSGQGSLSKVRRPEAFANL